MLRAPAFAVPFLLIPVALYAFFGALTAGSASQNPNLPVMLFTGFSVFGAGRGQRRLPGNDLPVGTVHSATGIDPLDRRPLQ